MEFQNKDRIEVNLHHMIAAHNAYSYIITPVAQTDYLRSHNKAWKLVCGKFWLEFATVATDVVPLFTYALCGFYPELRATKRARTL